MFSHTVRVIKTQCHERETFNLPPGASKFSCLLSISDRRHAYRNSFFFRGEGALDHAFEREKSVVVIVMASRDGSDSVCIKNVEIPHNYFKREVQW